MVGGQHKSRRDKLKELGERIPEFGVLFTKQVTRGRIKTVLEKVK